MRIYRGIGELPADFGPSVVTIGNFDGVHLGHRAILRQVRSLAYTNGWKSSALTFDPHPTRVLAPERAPKLLTTLEQRAKLMAAAGLQQLFILPFDLETARLSPEEFAGQLLARRLQARAVLVGENFRFGHKQSGDVRTLAALGQCFGFAEEIVPAVRFRGRIVSSSAIRSLIIEGQVALAARLLDRPYSIQGRHVHGRGVGARQTVPTINLETAAEVIPARGVYATRANGVDGVTNIGYRPTFGASDRLSIETFLVGRAGVETGSLGADGGPASSGATAGSAGPAGSTSPAGSAGGFDESAPITLEFLARLRDERKFDSPEALKARILFDAAAAQRYFRRSKALCRPASS